MNKVSYFLMIFLLVLQIFAGCNKERQPGKNMQVVKDMTGRMVEIPDAVNSIICLAPGTLRLVVYLQAQSMVAGIENFERKMKKGRPYLIAHPELCNLPVIGPGGPGSIGKEPDMEAVMGVKPDLIFISSMSADKADALQNRLKIPVVVLSYGNNFGTWDIKVYDSIRLAGTILKKKKRADEVIAFIENTQRDIIRRGQKEVNRLPVYAGAIGFKGLQGIESTDSTYWPFTWAGAENTVKDKKKGHLFINKESLLTLNPEVIFLDGAGMDIVKQDMAKKRDFYRSLKAFKTGKVFSLFPFNFYLTNIGTVLVDGYAVGKVLKKEAFKDISITEKAGEIYLFLLGKDVSSEMERTYGKPGSPVELQ